MWSTRRIVASIISAKAEAKALTEWLNLHFIKSIKFTVEAAGLHFSKIARLGSLDEMRCFEHSGASDSSSVA